MIQPLWKEIPFRYPKLLRFFEEISAIPRESYHEEKIADYLVAFALERGLPYCRDEFQNVLIQKSGTPGYEDHAPLLLQGHIDMVCEKNADVIHDFLRDPLDLYVENGWLRARGTTLGADDGVAVAIMLSILDGDVAAHPPIECLFTASEEVGMDGAESFDYSRIEARRMINLDSTDEHEVLAGCAGGLHASLTVTAKTVPTKGTPMRISVKGLAGGHSGEDIHRGRANANRVLGRVLLGIAQQTPLTLIAVNGGNKDNAIPREAEAMVAVADAELARQAIDTWHALLSMEMSAEDGGFTLSVAAENDEHGQSLNPADTERVLLALTQIPCGVLAHNRALGGIVDLSCNLGVVRTHTDTTDSAVTMTTFSRSSEEAQLDALLAGLTLFARAIGADIVQNGRYAGWHYVEHSAIRDAFVSASEAIMGQAPRITIIHAGLECGLIKQRIPEMDIISCGPNIRALHSPDEALELASFERFFAVIERLLKSL